MSTTNKRGFTREQAADYAGVSPYKIANAIKDNLLPAHKDHPKSKDVTVFREDLDAWMNTWVSA